MASGFNNIFHWKEQQHSLLILSEASAVLKYFEFKNWDDNKIGLIIREFCVHSFKNLTISLKTLISNRYKNFSP